MPNTFTLQPTTDSLKAGYNPILVRFEFDTSVAIQVAYCDIYINNIFHKTISKMVPVSGVIYEFDLQDGVQEYFRHYLGINGSALITNVPSVIGTVYCRIRKGYLSGGFLVSTGIIPVQGSYGVDPIAGTGYQSNSFFATMSALQNPDNPALNLHLNSYKNGTWTADTFPLSHRPRHLSIGANNSDFFPIVYTGNKELTCIKLNYKIKGAGYLSSTNCAAIVCVPVGISVYTLPNAVVGEPYSKTVTISGTGTPVLSGVTKPTWMTITVISPTVLQFGGTPAIGDVGDNIPVSFTLTNACGNVTSNKTLDVGEEAVCVPVGVVGVPDLPNGTVGVPYSYSFSLTGDAPFDLQNVVKPAWMTITVIGSTVSFSGTPLVAGLIDVDFEIHNCGAGWYTFDDNANIAAAGSGCKVYEFAVFGSDDSTWTVTGTICGEVLPTTINGYVGDGGPGAECYEPGSVSYGGNLVLINNTEDC